MRSVMTKEALYWPELDKYLASGGDIAFKWSGKSFRSSDTLKQRVLKEKREQGSNIFDSPKVRLASDPIPGQGVLLDVTGYLDSVVTNDRVGRADEVKPLANSDLSNHIGCGCLAFDRDGRLALTVATRSSAIAAQKIAPSGSGSCDLDDFPKEGGSLVSAVASTMERELREECGIAQDVGVETRVIGFRRMRSRAGKPDFIGVARVDGKFDTSLATISQEERAYTHGMLLYDFAQHGPEGLVVWLAERAKDVSIGLAVVADAFLTEWARPESDLPAFLQEHFALVRQQAEPA